MGKPFSYDLRRRIVDFVLSGHSCREASRVFDVSASTAIRLVNAYRGGESLMPKRQGRMPGTVGKLVNFKNFLSQQVMIKPDITLKELATILEQTYGVCVHLSSIHRVLKSAGLSFKKRG